jgi:hypothetical protein
MGIRPEETAVVTVAQVEGGAETIVSTAQRQMSLRCNCTF